MAHAEVTPERVAEIRALQARGTYDCVPAVRDLMTVLDVQAQELARLRKALTDLLNASGDPNAVTGEFDTAAGRARRLLPTAHRAEPTEADPPRAPRAGDVP